MNTKNIKKSQGWINLDDQKIIKQKYHKYNFAEESANLNFPENTKIYMVGDLHGDFQVLEEILIKLTNLVEVNNKENKEKLYRWKGGNSWFICLGDLIDRRRNSSSILEDDPKHGSESRTVGEDDYSERKILDLLNCLSLQAKEEGGRVIKILGNHDLEQIRITSESSYLDYVSPKAYLETIEDMLNDKVIDQEKADYYRQTFRENRQLQALLRNYHFAPQRLYSHKLLGCESYVVLKIDNWILAHGGILSKFVEKYQEIKKNRRAQINESGQSSDTPQGLEYLKFINQEMRKYLSRKVYSKKMAQEIFFQNDSPIYNRQFGEPCNSDDHFKNLKNEIKKMEEKEIFGILKAPLRIVVAHCPQVQVDECHFMTWIPSETTKKTQIKSISKRFKKVSIKNDRKHSSPQFVGINGIKFDEEDLPQIWRLDVGQSRAFDSKWLHMIVNKYYLNKKKQEEKNILKRNRIMNTISKMNNNSNILEWTKEGIQNYFLARRPQVLELNKNKSKSIEATVIVANKGLPRKWLKDKSLDKN